MLVDVPKGDIIEGRQRECARLQGVVAAQHHRTLRAGHGAVHSDVAREDGWDVGVEGIRLRQNALCQVLFHVACDLVDGSALVLLTRQQLPAADPRQGDDLQRAGAGLDKVRPEPLGHGDARHVKRREDGEGSGPRRRVGDVMVAGEQEDRDAPVH